MIKTAQTTFVYEPFADTAEYQAVNRDTVDRWVGVMLSQGKDRIECLLDLATGVGTMGELFLEELPKGWKQPVVICLDKDPEALKQARKRLCPLVARLQLVHSSVEEMALPNHSVDVAVWGNGIHYLDADGQEQALHQVKRVLKEEGWLFFNSAFCAESRPPESIQFYRAQVRKAVDELQALGFKRDRDATRTEAGAFLPKAHYESLLRKVGFTLEEVKETSIRVYKTALEHISGFQQYAAGALRGYPLEAAAQALRHAVAPALSAHGQRDAENQPYVTRHWLAFIARPCRSIASKA